MRLFPGARTPALGAALSRPPAPRLARFAGWRKLSRGGRCLHRFPGYLLRTAPHPAGGRSRNGAQGFSDDARRVLQQPALFHWFLSRVLAGPGFSAIIAHKVAANYTAKGIVVDERAEPPSL